MVYAASSIYSVNVTYDNSTSGLTSTNIQDALDELYEKARKVNFSSAIFEKYNLGTKNVVITAGEEKIIQVENEGLMRDSFGNIRYYGANPNNYVTFNGEEAGWRIIGIFDVEDENGNVEKRIKLIRAASIGHYEYDDDLNDWTTATLNTYLNGDYYNILTIEEKSMIGQSKYYLGGSSTVQGLYADDYYNFERGTTVHSGYQTEWIGYVGLMYPSDYAYATDLSLCTKDGYNYDSDVNCVELDWLLLNNLSLAWTLSGDSYLNDAVFSIYTAGKLYSSRFVYNTRAVFPVFYLNSDVAIVSGDGTSNNPYMLG